MRKTISVSRVREMANNMLLHSPDADVDGREAIQMFIENILQEAGQYNGFRFLEEEDMRKSTNGKFWGGSQVFFRGLVVHKC